ncbi:MAG: pilin [Patescibacteria group bacterium]|jgi:hypothetical protein
MWFTRTLKKTDLGWLILIIGLFVFLPFKVLAGPVDSPCWPDYPTGGAPVPGFPKATDFALPGKCKSEPAFDADCINKAGASGVDAKGGFGCDPGLKCCLYPATNWICANNYVGDGRINITQTSCVKTDAQCASPNFKMASGAGCTDKNGGPVCCAIIKGGTAAAGSKAAGAAIPQTGSTAKWLLNNPEGTGLQLVPCTETGDCTVDNIVQQGVNFAKWVMGLAGALFLLVFVYGGAMYVVSFGRSDYVTKGKNAMTRGVFGIILVMGAWTVVSYVSISLGYKPVGTGGTAAPTAGGSPAVATACSSDATYERSCQVGSPTPGQTATVCTDFCKGLFQQSGLPDTEKSKHGCKFTYDLTCSSGQVCCTWQK